MIVNVKSVVACVRESANDRSVLEWASDEAVSRGADLRIVQAREVPASYLTLGAASVPVQRRRPPSPVADDASRRVVDWAVEYVRNRHGDTLTVDGEAIVGDTRDALIAESRRASVLVLGADRRGRWADASRRVVRTLPAAGPECPVVVVPNPGDRSARDATDGPVVVGVTSGALSDRGLGVAFEFASRHGRTVRAVRCWEAPSDQAAGCVDEGYAAEQARAARALSETLAQWQAKPIGVPLVARVVRRPAVSGLLEESRDASLVVVGAHGHRPMLARLFESVSQGVLRHANCPVAVVPEPLAVAPLPAAHPRDLTQTEQSARDELGGEVIALRRRPGRPGDQPQSAR